MLIVFLMSLTFCVIAGAEDVEVLKPDVKQQAPPGVEIVHDGVPLQCYNLAEYKELALLIIDYDDLWSYSVYAQNTIASMKNEIENLNEQISIWRSVTQRESKRAELWNKSYLAEKDYSLKLQESIRKTKWIPWAVVVVQSAAITAISFKK
jgi:hypothetical protein